MTTRYLGIDYGSRRIGLAVGDTATRVATPLATLAVYGGVREQVRMVAKYATDYDCQILVVGLPLNMDGTEGPQARQSRAFGEELHLGTGLPVHFCDERLSTDTAEELLRPGDFTIKQKKGRLDRVAAQVMLQGYLDGGGNAPGGA
ncbi:MAG: Holliday junction resolvase RuvX [Planctomycetes bacterium]|nr:Holliday junction resolvase RuvX [Planctomycetota bacterium]